MIRSQNDSEGSNDSPTIALNVVCHLRPSNELQTSERAGYTVFTARVGLIGSFRVLFDSA
jgi:hypothetical protein